MQGNTYKMVLAAIFASLGTAVITLGYFLGFGQFFWMFVGVMCVMSTISTAGVKYGLLCYATISLLCLILQPSQFFYMLGFIIFMGPQPVVTYFIRKSGKKSLQILIYLWYIGSLFAVYKFSEFMFTDFSFDPFWELVAVGVAGVGTCWLYGYGTENCQANLDVILKKISAKK
ncbi:MAG: hypothetical protein E7388_06445 [Ruminococcaceae bacterium]|nr:hypothetical protein [Oscillospiraceae bacterium]